MDVIPETLPKLLTGETTFSYYILIINAYSKIPKLYGMERIKTEEVMDNLDMILSIFGKIDKFGWWDLERTFQVFNLPPRSSSKNIKTAVFVLRWQLCSIRKLTDKPK